MEIKETVNGGYNNNSLVYIYRNENIDIDNKLLYNFIKRAFDIVVSFSAMILLLPLFVLIGVLIKIDSKGPIFFLQKRIGKNGKMFKLYKFRTMYLNADRELKRILATDENARCEYELNKKLENDPRITKMGKIIRKLSLDELPQLINIFIGNMTFIGPRPYLYREKKDMKNYYDKIIKVKPGLTGLWQVSGRSNVTFDARLKLDEEYLNNISLKSDLKIFLKTFIIIFKKEGAK